MHPVFQNLAKPIQRLLEVKGFTEPTLPQIKTIPHILKGKNVLLIAPTGTGKTEAAFLPLLHKILVSGVREPGIKLIYVTPLRALNRDMLERLEWWGRSLDLRVAVRHGDTDVRERRTQALSPPDIVVTTPETLQVFLLGKRLSRFLKSVQWVIVDEVHELADNKRGAQLAISLERLREIKSGDFQLIGLSATVGSPERVAKFLVGVERECEVIDVSVVREMEFEVLYPKAGVEDKELAQKLYTFSDVAARLRVMRELIESHQSSLVFTNTRPMAEILGSRFKLWDLKFPVSVHHGSLASPTRVRVERDLKSGELKGIICTSSMELGIDIGNVDLVIQYNSPRQVTRLVQRVGRSGHRIGEVAKGVVIVQDPDDALESLVLVSEAKLGKLEPTTIPEMPFDVLFHALVSELILKRQVNVDQILKVFRRAYPFRDLQKEDLIRLVDFAQSLEGRIIQRVGGDAYARAGRTQRIFEYYFGNLSMIPEFKQYFVVDENLNEPIGVLDESFIAEYGEPGIKFVMGGEIWRIVQVFRNKVFVKKDDDPLGAIPTWIGEEIPVPFEVAQDVGRLRREFQQKFRAGKSVGEISREIARNLGADVWTVKRGLEPVEKQVRDGLELPTDRCLTVEQVGDLFVVNACFGTLVNRTLARLLAHRLTHEFGATVATSIDPYRIILRSETLDSTDIVKMLCGELGQDFERDLREVIEGSRFFRWRLAQVARRMGILRREAELTSAVLDKLVRTLRKTPAFEEAFKETSYRDLNFEKTLQLLRDIERGKIKVISFGERKKPTPISEEVWRKRYQRLEPSAPRRLKLLAVASAEARLLSETLTLACVECKQFVEERKVYELEEIIKCPSCGSRKIGIVSEPESEVRRTLELHERGKVTRLWRKLVETSRLTSRCGKLAAIVLAGRGISPSAAAEILSKVRKPSRKLFELIMMKERAATFRGFR